MIVRVRVAQPVFDFDGVTPLNHQRIISRDIPTGEIDDEGRPKTVTTQEIIDARDAEGNPIPFLIRNAIAKAVQTLLPDEQQTGDHPPEIKDDVFKVMCRISAAGDYAELDDSDRALIIARAGVNLNALLKGRVIEALEHGEKVEAKANGQGKVSELEVVE